VDANYIAKLEHGRIRWPNPLYREALRAILDVGSDGDLGFCPPHGVTASIGVGDVEPARDGWRERGRRPALELSAGRDGQVVAPSTLLEVSTPTAVPARIGRTEIDQIWTAGRVFAGWDNAFGGGLVREAPMAQLRWSAGMLDAACPLAVRSDLYSAVGYLAHTCGFMAFDDYAYDDARRVFRFGLACAEEANDWHLRARLLGSAARLEVWVGRPDDGLTLVQQALVRSDRLTATELAMLYCLEARTLADMQRTAETLEAVGRADERFADRDPDEDPPWMSYYDAAQHAGDIGAALLDLAALDRNLAGDAAVRLTLAVNERPPELVRSRVLSHVNLVKLTLVTGDPAEAAAVGNAVLDEAQTLRSRRVADGLRELSRLAAEHRGQGDLDDLRERIASAVAA
jgi:hypothetical protein